ncbi:hypothetical protein AAG570_013401 [Ranatra chinensis]|uniref:Reverse transcriptase domain-containing protein n=1 Tax=Ranatra chinensis TaxID=642074 RepID=A0ABD0YC94_9HEMI
MKIEGRPESLTVSSSPGRPGFAHNSQLDCDDKDFRSIVCGIIWYFRQRPYHVEYTGSRPITEVKQRRAWSVPGWVTAWEHHVPLAFFILLILFQSKHTTDWKRLRDRPRNENRRTAGVPNRLFESGTPRNISDGASLPSPATMAKRKAAASAETSPATPQVPVSNSFELLANAPEIVPDAPKKEFVPPIVLNGKPANITPSLRVRDAPGSLIILNWTVNLTGDDKDFRSIVCGIICNVGRANTRRIGNVSVIGPEMKIEGRPESLTVSSSLGRPGFAPNSQLDCESYRQFLEDTRKVVKDKFRITNRGRTTQILTSNVEDFEALKGLFRLRELEFHTFALRSEHMKRFVIHGLAEGFSAEEVEEELKAALPAVVRVVQMEKREGGKKRKIPVFIVTTKQEVTINDLKGVGDISLHTFRVEKYRSGDTPPQCFRCQRYGHTSRYCNLKEVCVKCSGNHHTKDCKEGAQVKCANCQKAHVASYRQCETRIAFLEKRSSAPIGQRTPAGPVTQRRQWSAARPVATNYSFSQALGNQQGSEQMGSNIGTRQTGTNTASIKNVISEMKLLDRDIKELNILPMLNLLKQMMTEIRNSQDSVGRLEILIKGTVIAAGDFNARHRLWGCQKKNKSGGVLYDFVMDRRAALVAPSNPTCVPCNGGTPSTLDLVLTNSHKCITDMRTVTEGGSDHLPVLFNIWGRAEANVKRPIYNFAQTDWDLFRRSLDLNIPTASPPLDTPSRIEAAVESLTREINEAIRISTPTKSQLPPRVELPREIVELIKLKNAVRRRWQSQRREEYKKMMNQLQRAVRDKIAEWKTERWNKMLQNTNTRDNTFWNLLRRFNRQCGRTNPTLRDGSEVASTNPEKATLLAKYFSGVNNQSTTRGNRSFVEQVDAQVRRILTAPPEVSPTDTITETPTAKLYKHTTPVEIREVLTKLKTNKAPGSDGITNKVAKNISRKALTKLTNIINAILRTCHYPRQWKTATVVALPKPGKLPSLPSSYRPISLLSVLAKITDKIILSRLLRVTEALDIIPDSQFGFRRKHATTHQLSRVVSHVSEHMKSGRSTAMVSLDCEKAYDTVWTNGLLFRLTEYKFPLPLIKIMQSYLSDRNIRVRIGESLSEEVSLQAGLPQGSVLSP